MSGPDMKINCRPIISVMLLLAAALTFGCPKPTTVPGVVWFSDPLTAEEHVRLGAIYERDGQDQRALKEYAAALRQDPANLVAITGLGNLSARQDKPKLAVKYYRRALDLDPENIVVLNNLALSLLELGKTEEALAAADRAVELDRKDGPGDPRVLDTRARARRAGGDREGALADLARAVELCADTVSDDNLAQSCEEIKTHYDQTRAEPPE